MYDRKTLMDMQRQTDRRAKAKADGLRRHQKRLSRILASWAEENPKTNYYEGNNIDPVIVKLKLIFEFEPWLDQDDLSGEKLSIIHIHTLSTRNIGEVIEATAAEAWVEAAVLAIEYTQEAEREKEREYEYFEELPYTYSGGRQRKRTKKK